MTIVEAIKKVLQNHSEGLTCAKITSIISEQGYYVFKTTNPVSVVNHEIRKHCKGLDFMSAHPIKYFYIVEGKRGSAKYGLLTEDFFVLGQQQIGTKHNKEDLSQPSDSGSNEMLPAEKMQMYFNMHKAEIENDLLECIMNNSPAFFESLVVQLLLKLGYGYGDDAGTVIGKPHDGGIDGIINEDSLGLDQIYIQAKRYESSNHVGRKELQSFVGAMQNIKKGVFITTSDFTTPAKKYIKEQQQKSISLIDGKLLVELMVKHKIGIRTVSVYETYEMDKDFFEIE